MTEHPAITAMLNGQYDEPKLVGKCTDCKQEIFAGETVVEGSGYLYCDEYCYARLALSEGNINRVIAE